MRKARRWVLQGKRYLRGWKIDSNLATLRRSERTLPGGDGGGAQPHHPPSFSPSPTRRYAGTSTITAAVSFLLPAFHLRPSSSQYPPQRGLVSTHPYTSRKLISGLRRVRSLAL